MSAEICTGCGSTKPQSYYDENGYVSCCPERKMRPIAAYDLEAAEARGYARGIEAAAKAQCKWCRAGDPFDGTDEIAHAVGGGYKAWCESVPIRALIQKK